MVGNRFPTFSNSVRKPAETLIVPIQDVDKQYEGFCGRRGEVGKNLQTVANKYKNVSNFYTSNDT